MQSTAVDQAQATTRAHGARTKTGLLRALMNKACSASLSTLRCTMTTKNPRLTITLQPKLAAQLRRMSELTGNSQSYLISDLLDGSTQVFDRVIKVLEAAEGAKQSIKGKVSADLEAAQGRIESQFQLVMAEFDDATLPLLDEVEAVKRRARRGARRDADAPARRTTSAQPTPLSNRGVRYDQTTTESVAPKQTSAGRKPKKQGGKLGGVE